MTMKLIGSVLIVLGCSACGFYAAAAYRSEVKLLRSLHLALEQMSSHLQYKLLPLPILLSECGAFVGGKVGQCLCLLAKELEQQSSPNVLTCMNVILDKIPLPFSVSQSLRELAGSLGKFDLDGQLRDLTSVNLRISDRLTQLETDKSVRVHIAKTLGICAGIGLAIILL